MSGGATHGAAVPTRTTVTEHEYEPVPGLPERLPSGERILWQGSPRWETLALRAFHVRKVGIYFLIFAALSLVWDLRAGLDLRAALASLTWLAVASALAIALLLILARSMARATLYTITNRRIVMRFGVAISMTINLPFDKVMSASVRENADGTGDIPVVLAPKAQVFYWALWPHARPWHFAPAEPMLRAIPDAAGVARILGTALQAFAEGHQDAPRIEVAKHGAPTEARNRREPASGSAASGSRSTSTATGTGVPAH